MFFSLNKKILYTIVIFLILTFALFLATFYSVYGKKFMDEQYIRSLNTLHLSEANYENAVLRQELKNITKNYPEVKISNSTDILLKKYVEDPDRVHEFRKMADMMRIYNSRYADLDKDAKLVLGSVLTVCLLILILGMLLKAWILKPIGNLSQISDLVATGDLSQRVGVDKQPMFPDEISKLTLTFNQMLDYVSDSFDEVKEKERFLQSLIDSIPDGIRVIDEGYNIIIANKAYYEQTGKKQHAGAKCYFSSQGLDAPCREEEYSCPLREIKKDNFQSFTVIQQFANDPNTHFSINAAPMTIKDVDGKKRTYVVEAIRDLSADVRFSHQQKISSLGFLATSLAHEIKNHIGSVKMITEAILKKYHADNKGGEEREYLQLIYDELNECLSVPERLLSLSRGQREKDGMIDCEKCIKEVAALLDYEAKRIGAVVKLEIEGDGLKLQGNSADFKMMILNLCLNAVNALKENGVIKIGLKKNAKNDVLVEIDDNGVGIPEKDLSKIFEPFFSTSRGEKMGNGLGLPIVKSIVSKLNGVIDVKSKLGKGTKVSLKFFKQKR